MTKCKSCNKRITNIYRWEGEAYGKECWKKVALPALKAKDNERLEEWKVEVRLMIEIARESAKKTRGASKKEFMYNIIEYYDEKNRLSRKQYDALNRKLTRREFVRLKEMECELGLVPEWYVEELKENT